MNNNQDQAILEGPLNKQIFRLAIPTMLGLMCQALYDIVDLLWIGMISSKAVAAMTVFSTYMWIIELFNEIVGAGSVSMISQYHGEGNKEKTQLAAEQTMTFKFILATAGALVMCLTLRPVLGFFSSDSEVVQLGLDYGFIRAAFLPIFFSSYSVNTIFRCTGNAKTPMILLGIAAVMNIILDPLMMFETVPYIGIKGLGLGMKGAAWATVISIGFSFIGGMAILLSGKAPISIRVRKLFVLNPEIDRKLFKVGLPSGFTLAFRNIFNIYLMKLVASYGTEAIAYVGIASRLANFGMMPYSGIAMGGGVIIGHCLGAGNEPRALEAAKHCKRICMIMVCIMASVLILLPKQLMSAFLGGTVPPVEGWSLLAIIGFSMILASFGSGYYASFSGSGFMKPVFWSGFIAQYCVMLPFTLIAKLCGAPVIVIWLAYNLGDLTDTLVKRFSWKKMKWLSNRV
ncbi:MAG: MATE family efflux transporter [Sphaerochaetaceae bacterium]|jgi:putative MATE family efflux protein|nr:MATE family efflux transporter [Sphaerochaetaceae bacterium]MDD3162723.1 MATE family efflux transporter [Sphaerochaetaceae bacterium]MDD4007064.1 MATE family efflux transporter [Sphaerochaetaceae bacterium]